MSDSNVTQLPTRTDVEFHCLIKTVEERFEKVWPKEFGSAKGETEVSPEMVSTGWWVVFENWPVAIQFGRLKPEAEPGDIMVIQMLLHKKPKQEKAS